MKTWLKELSWSDVSALENNRFFAGYARGTSGRYMFQCPVCEKVFHAARRDAQACSNACRQKAHRIAQGRATNRRNAAAAAAETKAAQVHELTCECCGRKFNRDGNAASNSRYCSNACKQKAYRDRRAKQ